MSSYFCGGICILNIYLLFLTGLFIKNMLNAAEKAVYA